MGLTKLKRQFMGLLGARRIPQSGNGADDAAQPSATQPTTSGSSQQATQASTNQGQQSGQGTAQATAPAGPPAQAQQVAVGSAAAPTQAAGPTGQQQAPGQQGPQAQQGQQQQGPPPRPQPTSVAQCQERYRELKMRKGKVLADPHVAQNAAQNIAGPEATLQTHLGNNDLNQSLAALTALDQAIQAEEAVVANAWNADLGNVVTSLNALGTQPAPAWGDPTAPLPQGYTAPDVKGSGPARWAGSRLFADMSFGGREERQTIDPERKAEIAWLRKTGEAVEVNITNPDGDGVLNGNFYSTKGRNLKDPNHQGPDTSKPVVLLLTGSGGSAEDQGFEVAQFYAKQDVSVLSVNYRGYGGSTPPDKAPSEKGLVEDSQAMLEFLLKTGYTPDKIIIHGYSLGGAVAAQLEAANTEANKDGNGFPILGAVADRPMTSVYDAARSSFGEDEFGKVGSTLLRPIGALGGALGKASAGAFNAKQALKRTDETNAEGNTPVQRVVTSDVENLGPAADKLRGGRQAGGASSGGEHFDHRAMLEANEDFLTGVIQSQGFTPSTTPDPLNVGSLEEATRRFDDGYKRCVEFCQKAAMLRMRLTLRPNRQEIERLLVRAEDFLQLLNDIQAAHYDQTLMGDRLGMNMLPVKQALLNQLRNALAPLLLHLDQNAASNNPAPPLEEPTFTAQQVQTALTQERTALTTNLAGLFPADAVAATKKQAAKGRSTPITKQFKVVMERVERFAADSQPGANTPVDALIEQLYGILNAAAACKRLYNARGYGASNPAPAAARAASNACDSYETSAEAQIKKYHNLKLLEDLSGGQLDNQALRADPALLGRLVEAADLTNDVGASARKALADYHDDAEEDGRDGFAEGLDAATARRQKAEKMQALDLRKKSGAALAGAGGKVPFWYFAALADGRPWVVPGVMRTQVEECAAGGTTPTLVRLSKKKARKGMKIIYDGAVPAADLLKAMNSTAFNTAGLVAGVTLKPRPAPQPAESGS